MILFGIIPLILYGILWSVLSAILYIWLSVRLSGILSLKPLFFLSIKSLFLLLMRSLSDSVQEHPGQRVWRFVFNDVRLAVNKDTRDYLRMNLFNTVRTATNNKAWAIIDLLTYERFI